MNEQKDIVKEVDKNASLNIKITVKSLLLFALPTVISMLFSSIYGIVDGAFVSNLVGTDALSAVNIVSPVMTVFMAVGTMMSTGGTAVVAKKLGEGKPEEAKRNFTLILIVALTLCGILTGLGYIFIESLLGFLGADEGLKPYCMQYATVILGIMPLAIFAIVFQGFLITVGKAHLSLVFAIIGGATNVFLDWLMIGVLKMELTGAALATGIGYALAALLGLLYFIFNRKNSLFIVKPRFDGKVILKSCSNGASEMINSLAAAVTTLMFNRILMDLAGSDGVSAITIIIYTMLLMSAIYMGYSIGVAPLISYNYGKEDKDKLRTIYRKSLVMIGVISVAMAGLSLLLADPLVGIFSAGNLNVHNLATGGFRIFSPAFLFMGINIFASGMFTALNNGLLSGLLSIFRSLVFVIAALLIFPVFMGVNGVWIAVPVAEALGFAMTVIFFRANGKRYGYVKKIRI